MSVHSRWRRTRSCPSWPGAACRMRTQTMTGPRSRPITLPGHPKKHTVRTFQGTVMLQKVANCTVISNWDPLFRSFLWYPFPPFSSKRELAFFPLETVRVGTGRPRKTFVQVSKHPSLDHSRADNTHFNLNSRKWNFKGLRRHPIACVII